LTLRHDRREERAAGGREGGKKTGSQRRTDDTFTGRAAQLAVMAELMRLRCNAAIPEVDVGTDVFAFKDDRPEVVRIQVKACTAPHLYADHSGYSAKFALPMKQFRRQDDRPPLFYALAVLRDEKWVDFLVVSRARLQGYFFGETKFGSLHKTNDDLEITVEFRGEVMCSGQELTDCRNAWTSLPPLQPTAEVVTQEHGVGVDEAVPGVVAQDQGQGADRGAGGPAGDAGPPPAQTGQA
jgi:hypothetical protein